MQIEKQWMTPAGMPAVVVMYDGPTAHRCGYVGVPKEHALYGVGYGDECVLLPFSDLDNQTIGKRGILPIILRVGIGGQQENTSPDVYFDVHGSITFVDTWAELDPPGPDARWWFGFDCAHAGDTIGNCSLSYCIDECESLARQLAAVVPPPA